MNENIHLLMSSFGTLFPDKIFSLTVNIIPDMFQIPWHFQVFQTSGRPGYCGRNRAKILEYLLLLQHCPLDPNVNLH